MVAAFPTREVVQLPVRNARPELSARQVSAAAGLYVGQVVQAISNLRDSVDGPTDDDQGISNMGNSANIVPTDDNGIAYSRSAANVLNVVYLNPAKVNKGGFFPKCVNGVINTSS